VHVDFKNELEGMSNNVMNSDIRRSVIPNTCIYDVTKEPDSSMVESFDFVINVSTIEEINYPNDKVFINLYN